MGEMGLFSSLFKMEGYFKMISRANWDICCLTLISAKMQGSK